MYSLISMVCPHIIALIEALSLLWRNLGFSNFHRSLRLYSTIASLKSAVNLPPGDAIFAQLAYPLFDVIFLFTSGITNLSLYKHCIKFKCQLMFCLFHFQLVFVNN